jgi:hypothetical protein
MILLSQAKAVAVLPILHLVAGANPLPAALDLGFLIRVHVRGSKLCADVSMSGKHL